MFANRGFGFIELLVAVSIIVTMTLGIVRIQMMSLEATEFSMQYRQASLLIYEIVSSMRANQDAVRKNDYNITTSTINAPTNCISGQCNPSQWATFQLFNWQTWARSQLPQGRIEIFCDKNCESGQEIVISIIWQPKAPRASSDCTSDDTFYCLQEIVEL